MQEIAMSLWIWGSSSFKPIQPNFNGFTLTEFIVIRLCLQWRTINFTVNSHFIFELKENGITTFVPFDTATICLVLPACLEGAMFHDFLRVRRLNCCTSS